MKTTTMNITNGFAYLITIVTTPGQYDEINYYEFIEYIPAEEMLNREETDKECVERILRDAKILPYITGYEATIKIIGTEGYPEIKIRG